MMQETSAVCYTDSGQVCLIARVEEIWWFGICMKRSFTKHFYKAPSPGDYVLSHISVKLCKC